MRCVSARILMTKRLHQALSQPEGLSLDRHLESCPACAAEFGADARFEQQLHDRVAAGALGSPTAVVEPAGIVRHLRGVRRGRQGTPGTVPWLAGATAAGLALFAGFALRPVHQTMTDRVSVLQPGLKPHNHDLGGDGREMDPRVAAGPAVKRPEGPMGHPRRQPAGSLPTGDAAGGPAPARNTKPAAGVSDLAYLDGQNAEFSFRWTGSGQRDSGMTRLLHRPLPPMRDDFVQPPRVLLADAGGKTAAGALKQYEKEAQVVDGRLFRKVTLALKAVSLEECCDQLRRQTGVDLRAGRGIADEKVTVFVDERPAREVMREVARLFGYYWGRVGEEGSYRYSLEQGLRAQLAEEEMRSKDVHAALLSLDEKLGRLKPYLERTPEELRAQYERIKDDKNRTEERGRLFDLTNGAYGPMLLYNRLTPSERAALFSGEWLRFGTDGSDPDRRLPGELRLPLLKSAGLVMFPSGTILSGGFGVAKEKATTPIEQVPNADPEVLLHLDRSEAGNFTLDAGTYAYVRSGGKITSAGGSVRSLASGHSPSTSRPDNATANAALRKDPRFSREIALEPKPSCPRLVNAGENAEQIEQFYRDDAELKGVHVTSADVWEAVHAKTGLPIVADSYTHLYPLAPLKMEKRKAFDALCKAGDEMGVLWRKDGEFLLARSTAYYWDKLKEVPNRLLARWKGDSVRNEGLPLEDLLEMATLSDQQLGSRTVGLGITHCWGLDEWGIIGGGPFITGVIIPSEMRTRARDLRILTPGELKAMQQGGLPLGQLSAEKLRALDREFGAWQREGMLDNQARAKIDYVPSGWYVWSPTVNRARYEAEAKHWPLVYGPRKEEVLARARRYDPGAGESSVRWTRGQLEFGVLTPEGDRLGTGGVSVELPLE